MHAVHRGLDSLAAGTCWLHSMVWQVDHSFGHTIRMLINSKQAESSS